MIIIPEKRFIEAHEFNATVTAAGRWELQRIKNGATIQQTEFPVEAAFPNLLLDRGLNRMGVAGLYIALGSAHVGTGTDAPEQTQTQLVSRVATSTSYSATQTKITTGDPLVLRVSLTYTFAIGAISANLTEIAAGDGGVPDYAFSRALILDAAGNPTAFPVEADEQLMATYVLEIRIPAGAQTATQKIGATTYDVSWQVANFSNYSWDVGAGNMAFFLPLSGSRYAYSGGLPASPLAGDPSGSFGNPGTSSAAVYVTNSFQRTGTLTFGPSAGNGSIRTLPMSFAGGGYYAEYTPAIVKTNTQNLVVPYGASWGRAS